METIVQEQIRCPMLHLAMQGLPPIPRKLSLIPKETIILQTSIMVILNYCAFMQIVRTVLNYL